MSQPWIDSPRIDGAFILAPALVITALLLCFQQTIGDIDTMPIWMWGVLVIGVDVAHVYSTLFRTYADPEEFRARRVLYTLVPLACWAIGTILYSIDPLWFWRTIAYLAVFHFVRQQYGLMMIYRRNERGQPRWFATIDKATIYMATLYPLIYWHTHLPRQFEWFIAHDFIAIRAQWLAPVALWIYAALLVAYVGKELWQLKQPRRFNLPKNLLMLGTAASWWVGIVAFDSDIAFTAANVLAHGIPYMALIWIYGRNQSRIQPEKQLAHAVTLRRFFTRAWLPVFIGLLVLLAYVEEGLWDALVWTEHRGVFAPFGFLPAIEGKETLALLVPLLALPQLTHYALDGFIWRLKTPGTDWKRILFYNAGQAT
ncbi:MAG: hypothetical protein V4735_06095 [Pseudomonadota bacterium]